MTRIALTLLLLAATTACNNTDPGANGTGGGHIIDDPGAPAGPMGPAPAVPGGTIPTPPRCHADKEAALTIGDAVTGFDWVWDGSRYLIAYASGGSVFVGRWNADGTPTEAARLIDNAGGLVDVPSLAAVNGGYVLVWEADEGVRGIRLDAAGKPASAARALVASTAPEVRPEVSRAPGGGALLAWTGMTGSSPTVYLGRLDADLALSGVRALAGGPGASGFPGLAGDDVLLGAVYCAQREGAYAPRFVRLDSDLQSHGEAELRDPTTGDARLVRALRTSFGFLTAWEDGRTGDNQIYMALTDTQGGRITEQLVEEPETGDANWPNLAFDGKGSAIAYYQFRTGAPQIYLSYVDAFGQRVGGGADLQVSQTPGGRWARYPDILWTGANFGVTWIDARSGVTQLYFNRVTCN